MFVLTLVAGARAQSDERYADVDSPGLVIEATLGWDGTVDQGLPVAVSFLISNYSEQILEGRLTLTDPMSGREVQLGEVVVGPQGTRRFASIQDMTDWFECFATLTDGDRVLWRRELALITGKAFNRNAFNYALLVDEGGRQLSLPGEVTDTTAQVSTDFIGARDSGRLFHCLTAKPWQVPDHPGPLLAVQAVIFPEGAAEAQLNAVQWRAVARWMCLGGTVFVHDESREIIETLRKSAPLGEEAAVERGAFAVRPIGLGAIYEYQQPLFASEGEGLRQALGDTLAMLPWQSIGGLADSRNLHQRQTRRADANRMLIVAFFGVYTLLSGVVALMLFRTSQRRIAIYTVAVVAGASVLSGLLGAYFRFSRGDLRWMTVTQAGAGGLVQVGSVEVQSAGGRNTRVAVAGEEADLQFTGHVEHYNPFDRHETPGHAAFTWQPNLAARAADVYQVEVPITPWGRRRLLATAFRREVPRLGFELNYEPRAASPGSSGPPEGSVELLGGEFSLTVVNNLPFDITGGWLIVGATHDFSNGSDSNSMNSGASRPTRMARMQDGSFQAVYASGEGPRDVYHMSPLPTLSAGTTYKQAIPANFQFVESDWEWSRRWPGGTFDPYLIPYLGTASAWIVGTIEESPILTIDEQRSDFLLQDELHVFVQEILPEDMPDAGLFLGTSEEVDGEAATLR